MQADIFVLGRYASIRRGRRADQASGVLMDAGKAANRWVAVYRACALFAFLLSAPLQRDAGPLPDAREGEAGRGR